MVKLSCKSCGAKLELTDNIDRFSRAHCGAEWIVNRSGGIVSLKAVEEGIGKIAESTKEIVQEIKAAKSYEGIRNEEELRRRAKNEIEVIEAIDRKAKDREAEELSRWTKAQKESWEKSEAKKKEPLLYLIAFLAVAAFVLLCFWMISLH
jgi:hypothetical protein